MRPLGFSLLVLLSACASDYKGLQRSTLAGDCVGLKPTGFNTSLYNTRIDVIGKHLSGLMLIKPMEDTYRVVFTNEAGVTFFDLSFGPGSEFKVVKVIPQLNKKAVIRLLQSDLSLMLGLPFRAADLDTFASGNEFFFGTAQKKETAYFITDKDCASLQRLELGSARKRKVSITFSGAPSRPETIQIRHHTFDMVMNLHLIERNVTE